MLQLTLHDIADITGGRLAIPGTLEVQGISPESVVSGVVDTDSREIRDGGVFVAKPGEFSDGFLFIDKAVSAGASLVIAERPSDAMVAQIIVDDAVLALGALATEVVRRVRQHGLLRIVGITGSNGKTTTKNLLRSILESEGETVAPRDSFNNEVGAPLTMLKLTPSTSSPRWAHPAPGRSQDSSVWPNPMSGWFSPWASRTPESSAASPRRSPRRPRWSPTSSSRMSRC
jgi:UDP-N-acetylmuramoyl-tripeptide--D-alanyl-D-alanine ligase